MRVWGEVVVAVTVTTHCKTASCKTARLLGLLTVTLYVTAWKPLKKPTDDEKHFLAMDIVKQTKKEK